MAMYEVKAIQGKDWSESLNTFQYTIQWSGSTGTTSKRTLNEIPNCARFILEFELKNGSKFVKNEAAVRFYRFVKPNSVIVEW